MSADPRGRMLACATPDGDIAEGALWLAADDGLDCEPRRWLSLLDEVGTELRGRCHHRHPLEAVPVIAQLLRERLHLRGAGGGDPRTHYLHTVMERGCGVPIACSAIWIAVGRRAGLQVEGVGLPGRFVVRVGGALVDPFAGGEVLDEAAARLLVAGVLGAPPNALDPAWLGATSPRTMLTRMSRNLRGCYASLERWNEALRAADRCVVLAPDEPMDRRDRGLLHWRLGHHGEALEDLTAYLAATPEAGDRASVGGVIQRVRAALN
ncbi:MAG: SirB1 family protein [Candidatus Dormibacteria bacterium]